MSTNIEPEKKESENFLNSFGEFLTWMDLAETVLKDSRTLEPYQREILNKCFLEELEENRNKE